MKYLFTFLLISFCVYGAFSQINPGFFEMRLVDDDACNRVRVQMRAINTAIPERTNTECQGLPGEGNTINYDFTFTLFWSEPSITNATDILVLDCVTDPDAAGYNVRDVGGSVLLDLGMGYSGKGFANGAFTPLDFPETWTLNTWMEIVTITLANYDCGLGNPTQFVDIAPLGMFGGIDINIAMDLPDVGVITDYTPAVVGVLPLDLLSFRAQKENERNVILNWTTVNEVNTSHMIIERSIDRLNWQEVGKVKAAGESTSILQYEFLDLNVYDGRRTSARFYYRLMVVDLDGSAKKSHIEVVQFGRDVLEANVFVFPNPATDGVNVELNYTADNPAPADMLIYNELGQIVYRQIVPSGSTFEFIDFSKSGIHAGAYTLQVIDQAKGILATEKLIVQR